jgi:hypothetical protein
MVRLAANDLPERSRRILRKLNGPRPFESNRAGCDYEIAGH